jgi:hypothetical protein
MELYSHEEFRRHLELIRNISRSTARAGSVTSSRLDYLEARLAAIEAHLGILPPSPPAEVANDPVSAIEDMVASQPPEDDLSALDPPEDPAPQS